MLKLLTTIDTQQLCEHIDWTFDIDLFNMSILFYPVATAAYSPCCTLLLPVIASLLVV